MTDYTPTAQWILAYKDTIAADAHEKATHYVAIVGRVDYFTSEAAALRAWKDTPGSLVGTIEGLADQA